MNNVLENMGNISDLANELSQLIETSRSSIAIHANKITIALFWNIGNRVSKSILNNERGDYGKQVVAHIAEVLSSRYGRTFNERNLRRMIQFVEQFPDFEIVSPMATKLSWSHIVEILPIRSMEAKLFYLQESSDQLLSRDDLRNMIARKAFERKEIANSQIQSSERIPMNAFKDPYLFDILGLKDDYLENDLETAILVELEKFILEFGKGFTFVDKQKRMIIDGDDFYLDLLFFNRELNRLVAVELKLGKFKSEYAGQLKLYLKWLNRFERKEWENEPIGLILCSEGNREQIELMEMDKDGIMVAEYWTTLPPKDEFERRIKAILNETKEKIARRNQMLFDSQK